MLYNLHELGRAAMTPYRLAAEANAGLLRHPYNPLSYTPAARVVSAALDVFEHTTRPYGKPDFNLPTTTIAGRTVAVTEEVVLRKPFGQLRHFKREGVATDQPRLLLVAPHSGHYATLLRGTVEALLPDHDIYITEWRDGRMAPLADGPFSLDDYIDYLIAFLHYLGPGTHIMAVCQPAVPVLCAVSLMATDKDPCQPRSMTLMGGPIDTRINPTVPNKLAKEHSIEWFEHGVIQRVPVIYPGFMREVYPGYIQLTGFMQMNLEKHVGAHIELFNHLVRGDGDEADDRKAFYEEYRAVMDLPAEYYLQTVKQVFQEHQLPRGLFVSRGRKVEPRAITRTALLTVEGERDDISGVGQTKAAQDLCTGLAPGQRAHYEQPGVGHYGVFNGRRWKSEIAPRVTAFIKKHDKATRLVKA